MDVLMPRILEEALALKAQRPEAVPIAGGTDLMVELNALPVARPLPSEDPKRAVQTSTNQFHGVR